MQQQNEELLKSMDYGNGCLMKPFFNDISNFWTWVNRGYQKLLDGRLRGQIVTI